VELDKVILGDCRNILDNMKPDSVDLIITSPPYANNRKTPYVGIPTKNYVEWFMPISLKLKRVLKPEGSFILNMKERTEKGERQTYVLEVILRMKEQGWHWVEEYIWHKKNCYPGKWPNRFRDAWERCLHFTKNKEFKMFQDSVMVPMGEWKEKRMNKLSQYDKIRHESRALSGFGRQVSNWQNREKAYPTNVLHLPTVCSNKNHSAAFPIELPIWFINLFTLENDVVLDPFLGSGTTAIACVKSNRHYIGIEINKEYCEIARSAIDKEMQIISTYRK